MNKLLPHVVALAFSVFVAELLHDLRLEASIIQQVDMGARGVF